MGIIPSRRRVLVGWVSMDLGMGGSLIPRNPVRSTGLGIVGRLNTSSLARNMDLNMAEDLNESTLLQSMDLVMVGGLSTSNPVPSINLGLAGDLSTRHRVLSMDLGTVGNLALERNKVVGMVTVEMGRPGSHSMGGRATRVIAAVTYQIIPADTQYAEIPLAAVSPNFQSKGIGSLLYIELRKKLQNVGIRTIFCWRDKESEGF